MSSKSHNLTFIPFTLAAALLTVSTAHFVGRKKCHDIVKGLFSSNEIVDYFRCNFYVFCNWIVVMADSKMYGREKQK